MPRRLCSWSGRLLRELGAAGRQEGIAWLLTSCICLAVFFLLWSRSSALTPLCRPHPGVSVEHAKVCRASQLFPEKEPWPAWDFGARRLCAGAAFPHLWCGTFPARAPFPDFGKSLGSCPGWAGGLHRSSPAPAPPASALLCGDRQLPNLSLGWFNFNPQNEF